MVVFGNHKYACLSCIRGHRSSSCVHKDRILLQVRKPGRKSQAESQSRYALVAKEATPSLDKSIRDNYKLVKVPDVNRLNDEKSIETSELEQTDDEDVVVTNKYVFVHIGDNMFRRELRLDYIPPSSTATTMNNSEVSSPTNSINAQNTAQKLTNTLPSSSSCCSSSSTSNSNSNLNPNPAFADNSQHLQQVTAPSLKSPPNSAELESPLLHHKYHQNPHANIGTHDDETLQGSSTGPHIEAHTGLRTKSHESSHTSLHTGSNVGSLGGYQYRDHPSTQNSQQSQSIKSEAHSSLRASPVSSLSQDVDSILLHDAPLIIGPMQYQHNMQNLQMNILNDLGISAEEATEIWPGEVDGNEFSFASQCVLPGQCECGDSCECPDCYEHRVLKRQKSPAINTG